MGAKVINKNLFLQKETKIKLFIYQIEDGKQLFQDQFFFYIQFKRNLFQLNLFIFKLIQIIQFSLERLMNFKIEIEQKEMLSYRMTER